MSPRSRVITASELVGDAMLVVAVDEASGGEDEAVEGLGVMGVVGDR
jgi:hypothetical protein